jgi:uncharacterized Zn finger protein
MAYYLREISTKCQACLRKLATHELLNSHNAPCGKFCERCGRLKMSSRNAEEAKRENVRIQDVK